MPLTIDELQIEIQGNSTNASKSIDSLQASLFKLKNVTKGGAGLTTVTNQLKSFSTAAANLTLPGDKLKKLVESLKPLGDIQKSNLGATLNQLKKIPEITKALDEKKLSEFASKIKEVTAAVKPLSVEMEKVSNGFSNLPANIQRAINANAKLTTSNKAASNSWRSLGTAALLENLNKARMAVMSVSRVVSDWIFESNKYVEDMNLFTASMGEYAESAQEYAEKVGNIMGIDPGDWMRNQGIFMTLATGFGVVSDKAALMSKNLTQLGYDISSFFNITSEQAMQKLQSGISGKQTCPLVKKFILKKSLNSVESKPLIAA